MDFHHNLTTVLAELSNRTWLAAANQTAAWHVVAGTVRQNVHTINVLLLEAADDYVGRDQLWTSLLCFAGGIVSAACVRVTKLLGGRL